MLSLLSGCCTDPRGFKSRGVTVTQDVAFGRGGLWSRLSSYDTTLLKHGQLKRSISDFVLKQSLIRYYVSFSATE